MRKIILFAASLAVVFSCQKAEIENPQQEDVLEIVASLQGAQDVKTSHSDEGPIKTSWVENDGIGVYSLVSDVENSANVEYSAATSGAIVSFNQVGTFAWKDDTSVHDFYAYYPYTSAATSVAEVPFTVPAVQTQAGANNLAHIAATDFLYATTSSAKAPAINLSFNHALSVLNLKLYKTATEDVVLNSVRVEIEDADAKLSVSEGTVDLTTGALTVTTGTNQVVLNLSTGVALSGTAQNFYIQITPGHAGKTLNVYAKVNGSSTEQLLTGVGIPAGGIPAGKKAKLSLEVGYVAPPAYIDLSAAGTSNCYIVNEAAKTYRFNATVMGNGYVPAGLAPSGVTTQTLDPKSVLVLWYAPLTTAKDVSASADKKPIVLESVTLTDGYIYFDTPAEFVDGNVVIAAFAEEGVTYEGITVDAATRAINNATILWSWNLWCVEGYDIDATAVTIGGKTISDRNLGALINGMDIVYDEAQMGEAYRASYAIGNQYQFGRKDPIPSFYGYTSYTAASASVEHYIPNFTPIPALRQTYSDNAPMMFAKDGIFKYIQNYTTMPEAVSESVKYPYLYFEYHKTEGYQYTWQPVKNDYHTYMWGGRDMSGMQKSLYDPCPQGWKMWDAETSNAITAAVAADPSAYYKANGIYSHGTCFPLTGVRGPNGIDGYLMRYMGWPEHGLCQGDIHANLVTSTASDNIGGFMPQTRLYLKHVKEGTEEGTDHVYYITAKDFAYNGGIQGNHARTTRCIKE